jgi:two-component system, response regulator YesN
VNVLLVDDESFVIDYLTVAVDWKEAGIENVYSAYSGKQALKILEDKKVDILLSDIRMPGMSGLELIRQVEDKKIKCIVLSGHNDFEYAQQAIRHRAVNYLLKPARAEEVLNAIKHVADAIRVEWEETTSVKKAIRSLREHEPLMRQSFVRNLLRGQIPNSEELRIKQDQIKLPLNENDECVLLVIRTDDEFGKFNKLEDLQDFAIDNLVTELLSQQFYFTSGIDDLGNHIYVLKPNGINTVTKDDWTNCLEQTSIMLIKAVTECLNGSISVLIGKKGHFPNDIPIMYGSALQQLRLHVKDKNNLLVFPSEVLIDNNKHELPLEQLYAPPNLLHLMGTGQWDRCEDKLRAIMIEIAQREQVTTSHLLEACHSLANAYFYIIHKSGRQAVNVLGDSIYQLDYSKIVKSLTALESWAFSTLLLIREAIEDNVTNDRTQIIEKVQQYVEAHLGEDVSLNALADHVYLHPAYLSSVYKEITGEGVSSYIYRRKMEYAADLLKNTSRKIAAIAEEVGYQNTSYFIRVFKKYFASTPQKYREQ